MDNTDFSSPSLRMILWWRRVWWVPCSTACHTSVLWQRGVSSSLVCLEVWEETSTIKHDRSLPKRWGGTVGRFEILEGNFHSCFMYQNLWGGVITEAFVHDTHLEGNQTDYIFVYFLYICSCWAGPGNIRLTPKSRCTPTMTLTAAV